MRCLQCYRTVDGVFARKTPNLELLVFIAVGNKHNTIASINGFYLSDLFRVRRF